MEYECKAINHLVLHSTASLKPCMMFDVIDRCPHTHQPTHCVGACDRHAAPLPSLFIVCNTSWHSQLVTNQQGIAAQHSIPVVCSLGVLHSNSATDTVTCRRAFNCGRQVLAPPCIGPHSAAASKCHQQQHLGRPALTHPTESSTTHLELLLLSQGCATAHSEGMNAAKA
jgi:hypothetical protein